MDKPLEWQLGNSTTYLLADGKNAEEFIAEAKSKINLDFLSSFKEVKNTFVGSENYKGLEFCITAISNGKLYAICGGGARLFITRQNKVSPLLVSGSEATIISGPIQNGDIFEMETRTSKHTLPNETPIPEVASRGSLKQKAAGLIDKLLAKLPERRLVINDPGGKRSSSRKASLIGVLLLLILGISIYFGTSRQKDVARRELYEPRLTEAIRNLDEALNLADLSRTRARELILKSREMAKSLKSDGVEDERLDKLLSGISEHLGPIAGIYEFPANLFLDLGIVASNFKGTDLSLSGGVLRVLDSDSRRLIGVEVENKRTNVISGSDYLPDAKETLAYSDRSFILSSDGIREVTNDVELLIKADWEADKVLAAAFAGNVYVLDPPNNQIWRYVGVSGGFLEKAEWLGEGFTKDLSGVVSWGIDGSIWTVSRDGEIKVYSFGAPVTFSISGQSAPFSEVVNMFVSEEGNFVYLLDRGAARISVVNKNGDYVGEYIASELSSASDLAVDEDQGIIIFLSDSKLYSLEARHLEATNEDNQ